MRLIYKGRVLKDADTLEAYEENDKESVQLMFTAGHAAMMGGTKPPKEQRDPFSLPVRGLPGSKGDRLSRVSGRRGGMALIRKLTRMLMLVWTGLSKLTPMLSS